MNEVEWDGITERRAERRAAIAADKRSRVNGSAIEVPLTLIIVGFAAVILLQVGTMWGQSVLSGRLGDEAKRSKDVDDSLTCYVVKITQGADPKNLLFDCGFLEVQNR